MKRVSILLILVMLFGLCACSKADPTSPTVTSPSSTPTPTVPECVHQYADADCVTAKTCTLCGVTRGSALGHDYADGFCTRCGEEDATYVGLTAKAWRFDAVNETGSQMEYIRLQFNDDGTAIFGAGIYDRLSDVPAEERDAYMEDEENWYDYSGEIFYYAGYGVYDPLEYTVEGSIITCTLARGDDQVGTLILERTGGNRLTVTYFEGDFSIYYLQVGDILNCV